MRTEHTDNVKKKIRRYTDEEKKIALKYLQQYPDNLQQAFLKASFELSDRTPASIENKYYLSWKNDEDFRAVTTGGKNGFTRNVKNTMRVDGAFPEDRKLNTVEHMMKMFLELSYDDRNKIFSFFMSTGSIETSKSSKTLKK